MKNGDFYYGENGKIADDVRIHRALHDNVERFKSDLNSGNIDYYGQDPEGCKKRESLTKWTIENCAEFKAVNDALNNNSQWEDLIGISIKIKNREPFPRCPNCKEIYKDIHFFSKQE